MKINYRGNFVSKKTQVKSDEKERFKLYKSGKKWVVAGLITTFFFFLGAAQVDSASAATTEDPATEQTATTQSDATQNASGTTSDGTSDAASDGTSDGASTRLRCNEDADGDGTYHGSRNHSWDRCNEG